MARHATASHPAGCDGPVGRADARLRGTPAPRPTRRIHVHRSTRRSRLPRWPGRHDGRGSQLGERPGGPRRPDRRGRAGRRGPPADRAVDPGHRVARPDGDAGVPGRARPPGPRRARDAALRPPRRRAVRAGARHHRGLRAVASRRAMDPRWWLVHGRVRGRDPAARGPRPDRPGPSGLPDQSRWPRGVGELQGARAGRGHRGDLGPGRWPHRARRRRHALGHPARRGDGPRRAPDARRHARRAGGGAPPRAASPARVRHHGLAGRHRRTARGGAGVCRAREPRRADRPGRRRAVVGPPPGRGPDRGVRRAAAGHRDRAIRPDEREADDGRRPRELHRGDARAVRRRPRRHDRQPRPAPDRSGRTRELGPRDRRARVPAALPRDRRSRGPGVARRRRGGAARERSVRHAAPHRPHPGHPSRRHPAVPRARRRGQRPAAVGGARRPDGHPHDPVPRRALALAVPVPLAQGSRRRPRDGLGLERVEREPDLGDAPRRRAPGPRAIRGRPRRAPPRGTPRPDRCARRIHERLGLREPSRRGDRHARAREAGRSRGARPRPVRPRRRGRSSTPTSSRRSSRASPSTRRASSRASVRRDAPAWTHDDPEFEADVGGPRRASRRCSPCAPDDRDDRKERSR